MAGEIANLPFPIHVHMLRHSTGYALAAKGMDTRRLQHFLGHASITNTVRYTAMSPEPFRMCSARAGRNRAAEAGDALNDVSPATDSSGSLPRATRRRAGATSRKKTLEFLLLGAFKALRSGSR